MDWDADRYDAAFAMIPAYGVPLLELLAARPGDRVLDLGCGTGELTAAIAATGATVRGIDASPAMIDRARRRYPHLELSVADGYDLTGSRPVDAVFSNAVLHWLTDQDRAVAAIARVLRPGGRVVAEMGGVGNCAALVDAIQAARATVGLPPAAWPWTFPTPAEQATRLEAHGFTVTLLTLTERPTRLDDDGPAGWAVMFAPTMLADVPPDTRAAVLTSITLAAAMLHRDDGWYADYVRLRFVAVRSA